MLAKWSRTWLFAAVSVTAAAASVLAAPQERAAEKQETEKQAAPPARRMPRPGDVTKVFVLRNVEAHSLAALLAVFPASFSHPTLAPLSGSVIGVSAPAGVMAAIEETIKRLDTEPPPAKSVELTGYVLEALARPAESASVPVELESVVAQLKNTFSYASYRLLDTLIARGLDDSRLNVDSVGSGAAESRNDYQLMGNVRVLAGDTGPIVRLRYFRFNASIPMAGSGRRNASVSGDIEIRAGQKVVVGKSGTSDPSKAIILVLSAKLVD